MFFPKTQRAVCARVTDVSNTKLLRNVVVRQTCIVRRRCRISVSPIGFVLVSASAAKHRLACLLATAISASFLSWRIALFALSKKVADEEAERDPLCDAQSLPCCRPFAESLLVSAAAAFSVGHDLPANARRRARCATRGYRPRASGSRPRRQRDRRRRAPRGLRDRRVTAYRQDH